MTKYLSFVSLAVALTGCAGNSQFMVEAPAGTPRVAPAPNVATVVFIRESGLGFLVNFAIVDQASNFLGEAVAKSHFAVQVPAGRYFFVARGGEGTDVVRAEVAAGSLYVIRVSPRMGMWQASVVLDPIKRSEPEWSSVPRWLAGSNHLLQLTSAPQYFAGAPGNQSLAAQLWEGVTNKAERTLELADGTSSPLPLPPTPAPVVPASRKASL